jgi:hypothetical protein
VGADHYELLYCNKQVNRTFGLPLNGRSPEELIEVQSLLLDQMLTKVGVEKDAGLGKRRPETSLDSNMID